MWQWTHWPLGFNTESGLFLQNSTGLGLKCPFRVATMSAKYLSFRLAGANGLCRTLYCRVPEALHIHQQQHTSNLDCALAINPSWLPLLDTFFQTSSSLDLLFWFLSFYFLFSLILSLYFPPFKDRQHLIQHFHHLELCSAKFCKQLKKIYGSKHPVT